MGEPPLREAVYCGPRAVGQHPAAAPLSPSGLSRRRWEVVVKVHHSAHAHETVALRALNSSFNASFGGSMSGESEAEDEGVEMVGPRKGGY